VLPIPKVYQVHLETKHVELPEFKTELIPMVKFAQFHLIIMKRTSRFETAAYPRN
jgi:hypothetical protein